MSRFAEIMVGLFMVLFLAAMFILAMKVSNLNNFGGNDGLRSLVSAGGVKVGRVSAISYDSETFKANVTLNIEKEYAGFPIDTSASIYTAGLLGEQYIGLEPGAEEEFLEDGGEITLTQSAVVLERLISQVLFNRSGD